MAGPTRLRSRTILLRLGLFLIAGALAISSALPAPPGPNVIGNDVLQAARNIPGDSKPVILYADDIATWSERGQRTVILKGKVYVEQGVINLRCQQAVALVDEAGYQRTKVMRVDVYAEGEVRLENGAAARTGPKALVELNTRGELRIKSQASKVAQERQAGDPLVGRALAEWAPLRPAQPRWAPNAGAVPPSGVQRTSYQEFLPAAAPPAPERPPGLTPLPPITGSPPSGPPTPPTLLPPLPGAGPLPPPAPSGPSSGVPLPGVPPGGIPPPGPPGPSPGTAPVPPSPGASSGAPPALPPGAASEPQAPRVLNIAPRTGSQFNVQSFTMPNGERAILVTGGVSLTISNVQQVGLVDIEADRMVMWTRENTEQAFEGMKEGGHKGRELEFFLAGNVEIRSKAVEGEKESKKRGRRGESEDGEGPGPEGSAAPATAPPGTPTSGTPNWQPTAAAVPRARMLDEEIPKTGPDRKPSATSEWSERSPVPPASQSATDPYAPEDPTKKKPRTHTIESQILRADQVYYDVNRNVAIAVSGDLELFDPKLPTPIHLKGDEIYMLSPTQYRAVKAQFFSSQLPADPGLNVVMAEAEVEIVPKQPKRSIFGVQFRTFGGEEQVETQKFIHGEKVFVRLEEVPFLYFPVLNGEATDPLGPLTDIQMSYDRRVFGGRFGIGLDVYELLAREPLPDSDWILYLDYLTRRGPSLGSDFDYAAQVFGEEDHLQGLAKAYGIYDQANDVLGRFRMNVPHPDWRGRFLWRQNWWGLPGGFTIQNQVSALSDKNYLEQYFKYEFDLDMNQETFLYVKQQQDTWAWTILTEPHIRPWVTETQWVPRADGYLLGQSLFGLFTYNAHASAGFGQLLPTHLAPFPTPPIFLTDVQTDTGRFDLIQDLGLPLTLGPVRLTPYGVIDLTQYTKDLSDEARGRFYGAAGARAGMPLSRLYPGVDSLMLNLNGIYHKIELGANFYWAYSDTPFTDLPQLDRLDDDATDQARRDITPVQTIINPANGFFLAGLDPAIATLYNPQQYAIRRLLLDRTDTLDSVEVLQMDLRQRWQTKRGYPGMQHIVDWMTLDLSGSYFPQQDRDNFGEALAFLEYGWTWNVGDRTALVSTGWLDPIDHGARVFTIGGFLNRPDRTSLMLGYRLIDPVGSRAVTGAITYVFSPKYALTGSTLYDFGTRQALTNSLIVTRMGKDLMMSLGVGYNATINTFRVQFELLPTLVATQSRLARTQTQPGGYAQ